LYLPGLKNVVADFLSYLLQVSTETVAATAADLVDFNDMAAEQTVAQKRSACLAAHPLN
jgi:hypothetical protein